MLPASNMKIVTLAAAAATLGWNYTYTTTLRAAGRLENGVLDGDLIVVGSGDPSLTAADAMADRVFGDWAVRLKAAGIRTVGGRIVGDGRALGDEPLGPGWMWDDLVEDYSAGVGALQLNEGAVDVTIMPGPSVGSAAAVSVAPFPGVTIDNGITTAAAGTEPTARAARVPGSATLTLRGTIPLDHAPVLLPVSVDNPTLFFVNMLRAALIRNGIDVRGPATDDAAHGAVQTSQRDARTIVEYRSPPLSTLAIRLMKISQNQYAETLFRTIGAREAVLRALAPWGVAASDLVQRDGSGLSRYDLVTPDAIATILTHIARDPALKGPFEASLPVAGALGLTNRMKGTAAEGNARAKTGSMTAVRALSGYVTAADSETLVFAIIANNFEVPASVVNSATDTIVVKLANFRR